MKTIKDKQLLMAADFAGYPLKEEIKAYLEKKGWTITDIGVKADSDPNDTELMFHRIGLKVGSMITEKEFERALIFCGTGMGIHIAASKCPGVMAGVVESVPAALRAVTGNAVNVLAMGAFYVAPKMGCDIADAYLQANLGDGYEYWPNFYEFHKLAIDELEAFDYEEYKKNGFKIERNSRYVELSYGNKGPVIEIFGHLDVVPVNNQKLFKVKKEKNKLIGRGVADDKGPLLAATYAAIALKNKDLIKNAQVKIFAGGDEENGSSCITNYVKTHKAPTFGFTPDSSFPLVYGEKGNTFVTMKKNVNFKNIVAIKGGKASNVVIGEATFKVNNINKIKNKLKTPHKIKGDEITFIGLSAHGSKPELGKNAFLLGLQELAKLNHDQTALKIADAFLDTKGHKLNAYYKSKNLGEISFNVGLVTYKNQQLTISVDCRRPENAKHKDVVKKLLKSFNFKLVKDVFHAPLLFDLKSPLLSLLMDAYKKETGDQTKPKYSGGGTYAKKIANTVAFGAESINKDYHMHQDDEYIPINDLFTAMSIYAHAIYNLMNAKK